jgi:hypothetical protein
LLAAPPPRVRLLRAWSFQAKLGIICNTLLRAAPQLAHHMAVIVCIVALFAALSYLALGQRVSHAASYGAAFEETFSALLGLGYVKLPDVFPDALRQSAPEALLSVLVFYGREALLVMVLMQFFMATLGSTFMELKANAASSASSSIPQDVARHVVPELRAKAAAALDLRRRRWRAVGVLANAPQAAAPQPALPQSTEALQGFLKARFPGLASSKAFGDRVPAIKLGGLWLDLHGLQHLFAELLLQEGSALALLQTAPARAYAHRAADAADGSQVAHCSTDGAAQASIAQLPEVGRAAVAAGVPTGAVAAALAAAEQLMGTCGMAVDATVVQQSRLSLQQPGGDAAELLQQQLAKARASDADAPGVGALLQPGRDYTVQVRGGRVGLTRAMPSGLPATAEQSATLT